MLAAVKNMEAETKMDSFNDRYYRPDEIAEALNIDRSTVYRMIRDPLDPLPAYRLTDKGPLRVHGRDINQYLDEHKVQPENE
jgi:excisionase family DNA binding protein